MPTFNEEMEMHIDPSDYLDACSSRDIKALIQYLRDEGHLSDNDFAGKPTSPMEEFYEKDVDKLRGAYHLLGTDDLETIHKIASRLV